MEDSCDCEIHARKDSEPGGLARHVTYCGNYAVVTAENPQIEKWYLRLRLLEVVGVELDRMLQIVGNPPPSFVSVIYRVGEGVLADVVGKGESKGVHISYFGEMDLLTPEAIVDFLLTDENKETEELSTRFREEHAASVLLASSGVFNEDFDQ